MFMEAILSYFGTYTPAADGAMASFKFEYLTTLGFAAIVIFAGRAIVAHSALLRKYAIPAPVVSGIIFSISCLSSKAQELSASPLIRKLCRISVRTCFSCASASVSA